MDKKGYPSKASKKPSSGSNSSGRQHGESSSSSKKRDQSYSLNRYLETPQRHETWDWEQKAKRRSDKNHRL
ncbi:uncharacterized protein TrAtP1_011877 [Trichoderma atroviride]|uniref:uncharacterized protein n=1 Tax=Hypocrea atroviridis TaxID=63577 RepID=UPI00332E4D5A|nr:hypothetical protein TrAtP1_011877 [Trichoderma atroviride]